MPLFRRHAIFAAAAAFDADSLSSCRRSTPLLPDYAAFIFATVFSRYERFFFHCQHAAAAPCQQIFRASMFHFAHYAISAAAADTPPQPPRAAALIRQLSRQPRRCHAIFMPPLQPLPPRFQRSRHKPLRCRRCAACHVSDVQLRHAMRGSRQILPAPIAPSLFPPLRRLRRPELRCRHAVRVRRH